MEDTAIVLCGGRSTRMGRDKATLPFGGETLRSRAIRLARDVVGEVIVVGPGADLGGDVQLVRDPGVGPLAALACGLAAARGARALLVACDMPLLRPALLRRLFALAGDADACVPVVDGVPMTTCAVYACRLAPRAHDLVAAGQRALRALLDSVDVRWVHAAELVEVDPELESFLDCDTPADYDRALRLAGHAR